MDCLEQIQSFVAIGFNPIHLSVSFISPNFFHFKANKISYSFTFQHPVTGYHVKEQNLPFCYQMTNKKFPCDFICILFKPLFMQIALPTLFTHSKANLQNNHSKQTHPDKLFVRREIQKREIHPQMIKAEQTGTVMQPVAYIYNEQITKYVFSEDHPMKPKRMKMTHSLIQNFQLTQAMRIFHGKAAIKDEICQFHHPDYVDYLQNWVSPNPSSIVKNFDFSLPVPKQPENEKFNEMYKINRTFDCPSFEGLYDFCELAVGGSLDAADLIITGQAHHAINWSGGYHHAKKSQASGFCYVNDIVVCILELLKVYPRVLYLDIDVHHGDGVEEAFYHTNRVMTLSFHQYEEQFFPGTGEVESIGEGIGRYYSVNVPLKKGMDDASYLYIFKKITNTVIASYRPDVIVFQSGADSLSRDRLGSFQLTIKAYGECVKHMMGFNIPLIMLGGGGYTIENVARCWAYETSVLVNHNIGNDIPEYNQFYSYFKDDNFKIHFNPKLSPNLNTRKDLDKIIQTISQNMRQAEIRPSISFHYAPKHFLPSNDNDWEQIQQNQDSMQEQENQKYVVSK